MKLLKPNTSTFSKQLKIMALTTEQIKNLKPGTPIVINGTVNKVNEDGHILATCGGSAVWLDKPDNLSLPPEQPKHDPTRLFKKGDKVRVVERNGRHYDTMFNEKIWTVAKDERPYSTLPRDVQVNDGRPVSNCYSVPFYHLELITPVEERGPYKLIDSPNTYNIVRDKETVMTIHKKSHPLAKATAEAERDRLNAEWRKEHNDE